MRGYFILPFKVLRTALGLSRYPSYCTYTVTFRCNFKCVMCDSWKKPLEDELTVPEIEEIFSQIGRLDVLKISGGEPFVRLDLADIINTIDETSSPEFIHITTNGSLRDRILKTLGALRSKRKLHVRVSIDAIGKDHDRVRGVRGAYETALETVQALVEFRSRHPINLAVNQTIVDRAGLEGYPDLKRELAQCGVKVIPNIAQASLTLHRVGSDRSELPADDHSYATFSSFTAEELQQFFRQAEADAAQLTSLVARVSMRYYLRGLRNRLLADRGEPKPPCQSLHDFFRLLPNGDVPICFNDSRVAGNLRKASFREVWFGEAMSEGREIVRRCPGCWSGCEIIPSAIYSGDMAKWFAADVIRRSPRPETRPVPVPAPQTPAAFP
jgi:MoaA/NifB/PqqE/SkfB family radical SAM enzyme